MTRDAGKTLTKQEFVEKTEKFLEFVCREYENSEFFQRNGEPVSILFEKCQVVLNISFGNTERQIFAVSLLSKNGLIEKTPSSGQRMGRTFYPYSRISPTRAAFLLIENRKRSRIQRFCRRFYEATFAGLIDRLMMKFEREKPAGTSSTKLFPAAGHLDHSVRPRITGAPDEGRKKALLFWGESGLESAGKDRTAISGAIEQHERVVIYVSEVPDERD